MARDGGTVRVLPRTEGLLVPTETTAPAPPEASRLARRTLATGCAVLLAATGVTSTTTGSAAGEGRAGSPHRRAASPGSPARATTRSSAAG